MEGGRGGYEEDMGRGVARIKAWFFRSGTCFFNSVETYRRFIQLGSGFSVPSS